MDYSNYWEGVEEERRRRNYYERLYHRIWPRIISEIGEGPGILDVAGGNGQLLEYLGVKQALVLDISSSGLEIAKKKVLIRNWPILLNLLGCRMIIFVSRCVLRCSNICILPIRSWSRSVGC